MLRQMRKLSGVPRGGSLLTHRFSGARWLSSLPDHLVVGMPALSPTMQIGNLAAWKLNEGDRIRPGTLIAEVETDKATVDFEGQDDGYLAKILVKNGTKDVAVGTPICVVVNDAKDVDAFKDFNPPVAATAPPPPPPPPPSPLPPAPSPPKPTPQPPSTSAVKPAATSVNSPVQINQVSSSPTQGSSKPITATTSETASGGEANPLLEKFRMERVAYELKYGPTLLVRGGGAAHVSSEGKRP